MDYTALSSRKKALIISGSLLIHLLLLILMFIAITGENPFNSSRHLDELANILAQSPMESEDATVIFYDEPTLQEMGASVSNEPVSATADAPFDPYAKAEDAQKKEEVVDESVSQDAVRILRQAQDEREIESIEKNKTRTLEEEKILTAENNKSVRGEPDEPYRTVTETTPAQQERASSGIGNITMADIAKGFLKSMAQESGGKPTSLNAEQLARQRYGTRVWSLLRQSYNAYKSPTQLLDDIHTHAVFVLTIDKVGKLVSAELQHPKKTLDIIQIERSLLNAVYKAGLFPPIPKQFDVDTITLSYPLGIRGHAGTHMYDLIYE
ncbi:MAG: hypothetical protein ACHQVS_00925 [Candidatus Babeliales bacterium]